MGVQFRPLYRGTIEKEETDRLTVGLEGERP